MEYLAGFDSMSFEENALEDYMASTPGVVHTGPDCRLLSVEHMAWYVPMSFEENALEDYMVPIPSVVHTTQDKHPLWKPKVLGQQGSEAYALRLIRSGVDLRCAGQKGLPSLLPTHNKPLIEPQSFVAEVEAIHVPNVPAADSKHCWNEYDETDDELIELRIVKIQADMDLGKMPCYHHYTPSTDTSELCLRTFS